jgi:hypothetical protein
MSPPNLAKIVKALIDNPHDNPMDIIRGMGGEGVTRDALAAVFERSAAELRARAEESQKEADKARAAARVFKGLPKGITFEDACRRHKVTRSHKHISRPFTAGHIGFSRRFSMQRPTSVRKRGNLQKWGGTRGNAVRWLTGFR